MLRRNTNRSLAAQPTQAKFSDTNLPSIEAGSYSLTTQLIVKLNQEQVSGSPFSLQSTFTVAGERFALNPDEITGLFPTAGANGDFGTCLPHLLLGRTTLPWERSPYVDGGDASWLAVLVFAQAETPIVQSVTAGSLSTASTASPWHPAYPLEEGQLAADIVSVIDVPVAYVEATMPELAELPLIAHVREGLDSQDQVVSQQAVVLGNRLVPSTGLSTFFLVSLEGRYTDAGFNLQGAGSEDLIRLIVLKHWTATSDPSAYDFSAMMAALSQSDLLPVIPSTAMNSPVALARLQEGFVALPYAMRDGSHMPAWYRGPLLRGEDKGQLPATLPVLSPDALLAYQPDVAFFDVTYASAWSLGRALMLASPAVAASLYAWKLARDQNAALRAALPRRPHLRTSIRKPRSEPALLPPDVLEWLADLSRLRNLPFAYLVPEADMLPAESIRFFTLDSCWLRALFDGALSVGRVTAADAYADGAIPIPPELTSPCSGFIMRSAVAAAFPNLSVTGYDTIPTGRRATSGTPLQIRRQELLGANVLICLFDGTIAAVDIQPAPEVLHSGIDDIDGASVKLLRNPANGEIEPAKSVAPLPWRGAEAGGVLSLSTLCADMAQVLRVAPLTNSGFALQMIQSEFCARLIITNPERGR
jgi:hypothetical protein